MSPHLLTAFDYDLLLQTNYLQGPVGIDRARLLAAAPHSEKGSPVAFELALHLVGVNEPKRIVHIPRILSHCVAPLPGGGDAVQRKAIISRHFAQRGVTAHIASHEDVLGASLENHLRVRRGAPDAQVAIIIPTRDRLDLLEPCLNSIFASIPHNQVRLEIVVVDHQSRDPATLAYLRRLHDAEQIRVLPHVGPFNWALMNNRAAAATNADILVFLNNDTAVVTPDCWDELASQALRPEVGAVGARLLYANGTIQHAGAVLDGWTSFSSHEGMGQHGGDAGYLGRNALLRRVSTVTGACLATRASVFAELGGFDATHLPIEGNDTDYCIRADSRGLTILYDPYATLYHFESQSRGYHRDDSSRLQADEASRTLRARWPERVDNDPFYNAHFDRLSPPCTRLRPPPALSAQFRSN